MMWSEYNRSVRVCPLLERLDEMLSVAREHATQSIKSFVHLPNERSPALAPGPWHLEKSAQRAALAAAPLALALAVRAALSGQRLAGRLEQLSLARGVDVVAERDERFLRRRRAVCRCDVPKEEGRLVTEPRGTQD